MRRTVLVACAMLLAVSGCEPPVSPPTVPDDPRIGKSAPEFAAPTADGKQFRLSDDRGKVVLIDFWATWCGPCKRTLPILKRLQQRYQGQPFAIIGISEDEDGGALRQYLDRNKITWTTIRDDAPRDGNLGTIGRTWRINSIPTLFVLDGAGVIRAVPDPFDERELERVIDSLLTETAAK